MSLISPKNFITPFTNAVNLATIIVIALLFGIYRYSGGGVAMSSRKPAVTNVRDASAKDSASNKVAVVEKQNIVENTEPQALRPKQIPNNDSTIDDLLEKRNTKDSSTGNKNSNPSGSSLDDIAKQLGVE